MIFEPQSKNKKILLAISILLLVVGVTYIIFSKPSKQHEKIFCTQGAKQCSDSSFVSPSLLNCRYVINDQVVTLNNGYSEETVLNSNSKIITKYFGNEVSGDFNNDGFTDTAFILTQDLGGSGTFYYLVAALFNKEGCSGTDAVLLGDRIAPQTTNFQDGKIVVNFAERKIDEPMIAPPSVGVSKYFVVNGDNLVEINQK